ncbi:SRA-YDG, PUA-like domain protein [Tanacetum coccineum]
MVVLEHDISQKRSLDNSNDHEHEASKKSKTLVSAYLSPKTKTQVQVICETTQFCVGSEAHVKPLKKLSNTDISRDLRYNKDKRLKPPKSRRIDSTRSRETGKVKYLEPTCLKDGRILVPKVNTTSRRKTSNITNAYDCQIRKTFDGEDKLVGSQLDENNKLKNTKLPIIWKHSNSSKNGYAQISTSTSTFLSQKEVVRSQEIEKAKILFDVTYKQASYRNKLELNGKKHHHLKVLPEVKQIVKQKLNLMDAKKVSGPVLGVEVGNTFKYRQLLDLFGLHCQHLKGIDYTKIRGKNLAISIVDSHRYLNESERSDMLTYCGEGGIGVFGRKSPPKDQKLERGNLALKNCIDEKSPVRVIRKIIGDENIKMYVYVGLYIVKKCVQTRSDEGKTLFKFDLHKIPGQPQHQMSFNTSRYYRIWI